jgi:hypothetical protein
MVPMVGHWVYLLVITAKGFHVIFEQLHHPCYCGRYFCLVVVRSLRVSRQSHCLQRVSYFFSHDYIGFMLQDPIKDAKAAAKAISSLEGVVDHGLFLDMATAVIIAGSDGVTVQSKKL